MKQKIMIEVMACTFLGALPCGIIAKFSDNGAVMNYVKSLSMPSELLIYLIVLFVIYLAIIFARGKEWYQPIEGTPSYRISYTFIEIGPSVLGVYRVIAGVIVVLSLVAMFTEANIQAYAYGSLGLFFSAVIILILSWAQVITSNLEQQHAAGNN